MKSTVMALLAAGGVLGGVCAALNGYVITRTASRLRKTSDPWSCPADAVLAVSYTHLTLPTICSV